jgi:hypothetical protein
MEFFTGNMKLLPAALGVGLSLLTFQTAQASSAFTSNATLTYTITGDLSGVQAQGFFKQAAPPDSYVTKSGDGTVTANNPDLGPIPVGSSFTYTFAADGNVTDGTVGSHYLGNFGVDFTNTGSVSRSIGVTLAYQLNAVASGDFADSDVTVDYFNSDDSFAGFDSINASTNALANATQSGTSGLYSFTLWPNTSEGLYADVTIAGNLQAPVPVPAAVWLFGSAVAGMGVIGRRKVKAGATA